LLDLVDIHVEVPRIDYEKLSDLQALYELGYADDYRVRSKELAEAQARRGMDCPELP